MLNYVRHLLKNMRHAVVWTGYTVSYTFLFIIYYFFLYYGSFEIFLKVNHWIVILPEINFSAYCINEIFKFFILFWRASEVRKYVDSSNRIRILYFLKTILIFYVKFLFFDCIERLEFINLGVRLGPKNVSYFLILFRIEGEQAGISFVV